MSERSGPSAGRHSQTSISFSTGISSSSQIGGMGGGLGMSTEVGRLAFGETSSEFKGSIGPMMGIWNPEEYAMTTGV
jgi:hypothetical protein